MNESQSENEYRFREFRVLVDRAQVWREDKQVAITPKAVKLLIALIERRERVVSKEELIELVWPEVFVEEGNVKFQISVIRRTVGQDVVETVGKVGYQFVANLEAPTGGVAATNLPTRSRAVIGRDADIVMLDAMLLEHPFVSIVGTGGVGKTTLAKAVGHRILNRLQGGVWFASLSSLSDPDAIATTFASLIGATLGRSGDLVAQLARAIGSRRMMFVLDGCQQVRDAVASFTEPLLDACPGLSILATSRVPIRASAERVLRLEPLETSGAAKTAAAAARIPAVALFLDRAEAVDAKFQLHDLDAPKVAELCRMLDGLPLALEIIGSRVPVLGFDALGDRLAEFSVESGDPLKTALELSWSMLTQRSRKALQRFSVFGGSFELNAAVAVEGAEHSKLESLGAIGELVDHSLLSVERGRVPRYRLLDTTRAFVDSQTKRPDRRRFNLLAARHYAAKMAAADEDWNRRREAEWRDELVPDLDSLRGALHWALSKDGDIQVGFVLAGRSAQLWSSLSLHREGRHWAERALALAGEASVDPGIEAAVWRGLGSLLMMSDPKRSVEAFRKAAALYRDANEPFGLGRALAGEGGMEMLAGSVDQAEQTLQRARELLAGAGRAKSHAACLGMLAYVYATTDRGPQSAACLEEALEVLRETGDQTMIAQTEFNLAELSFIAGDFESAVARAETGAERLRLEGSRLLVGGLASLAAYLEVSGETDRATDVVSEALPLAASGDDGVLVTLIELIALLRLDERPVLSAKLVGWADATTLRRSRPRQSTEVTVYERLTAALEARLPGVRLGDARRDGAHWKDAEAIEAAAALLRTEEVAGARTGRVVPLVSVQ